MTKTTKVTNIEEINEIKKVELPAHLQILVAKLQEKMDKGEVTITSKFEDVTPAGYGPDEE